ncbi:hypothetical protein GCM10009760_00310 [Kitasatospora kazusensis]|uniref:Uncharacterized protein n=1 Tax=Kitasatospora kazusensis TaxID=407974 RepID=A0ABN2YLI3_9ACTN
MKTEPPGAVGRTVWAEAETGISSAPKASVIAPLQATTERRSRSQEAAGRSRAGVRWGTAMASRWRAGCGEGIK